VASAGDARPLPAAAAAFAALAGMERTTTALISGRALDSLRVVASPPEQTLLIGSHGAEVWLGPGSPALTLTEEQDHALRRAQALVQMAIVLHKGTTMELKPAGVVLHYRQASHHHAKIAVDMVRDGLVDEPGIFVTEGKMVLEMSVVSADKGNGLQLLRRASDPTAVLFAGDDVTDEHGFAVLGAGDVGIKVGDGESAAPFRVESPQALAEVLELLAAERAGWLRGTRA